MENGDGKERVTLTVCVSQERLLPPQIIFKGVPGHGITAELKEISGQVPGVLLCVQENAYQDSDLYAMCVEKWASMMGRGAIFTHDNAGVHLAPETGDKGHFLLIAILLINLKKIPPVRAVVVVVSWSHCPASCVSIKVKIKV